MPDNAMFDVNGNGSIGIGAGAGDGRGIHSDLSQDSSGRGTSLSSSITSSGQSGVIIYCVFLSKTKIRLQKAGESFTPVKQ